MGIGGLGDRKWTVLDGFFSFIQSDMKKILLFCRNNNVKERKLLWLAKNRCLNLYLMGVFFFSV